MDPVSLLSPLFSRPRLGRPVQDRRRKPHGEASGEGERGREAAGEVCGGVEEEGGGIRFAEGGGRAPAGEELAGGGEGGAEMVGEGFRDLVLLHCFLPGSGSRKSNFM